MTNSYSKTRRLVQLSIFMAIVLLQSRVPFLGNIPINPALSVTIIHITVIVAVLLLGTLDGAMVGFVWGLNSFISALFFPTSPFQQMVLSSPLTSVLPRVLMPLCVGVFVAFLRRKKVNLYVQGIASGILGSLLNTVFVLGAIALFKQSEYIAIKEIAQSDLWKVLSGIVVANGIPEAIAAAVAVPAIYRALSRHQS
ncbi:MAG: ECF transporter S component [Aerococcaceae bacterium]|nr:ECF transporter S component [Aerococcaceae bacterium]